MWGFSLIRLNQVRFQKKYTLQPSRRLASRESTEWLQAESLFWGFCLWWILQLRNLLTRVGQEVCFKQRTQRTTTAAQLLPFKCRNIEILVVWFVTRAEAEGPCILMWAKVVNRFPNLRQSTWSSIFHSTQGRKKKGVQKENFSGKIRFPAPEPHSPVKWHMFRPAGLRPCSADVEPKPHRGCRWLGHPGSIREASQAPGLLSTYTSPLFHVCFFSRFLVPSEKRGRKRMSSIKLYFYFLNLLWNDFCLSISASKCL